MTSQYLKASEARRPLISYSFFSEAGHGTKDILRSSEAFQKTPQEGCPLCYHRKQHPFLWIIKCTQLLISSSWFITITLFLLYPILFFISISSIIPGIKNNNKTNKQQNRFLHFFGSLFTCEDSPGSQNIKSLHFILVNISFVSISNFVLTASTMKLRWNGIVSVFPDSSQMEKNGCSQKMPSKSGKVFYSTEEELSSMAGVKIKIASKVGKGSGLNSVSVF